MIFHHMLSDLGPAFGKGPKRGFKKKLFLLNYFLPKEGLIRSTKIQLKNMKIGMGVPKLKILVK